MFILKVKDYLEAKDSYSIRKWVNVSKHGRLIYQKDGLTYQ